MESLDSLEVDEAVKQRMNNNADTNNRQSSSASSSCGHDNDVLKIIHKIISQLPAIAIASVLNFMVCSERVFQYILCYISFSIRLLFFFCCMRWYYHFYSDRIGHSVDYYSYRCSTRVAVSQLCRRRHSGYLGWRGRCGISLPMYIYRDTMCDSVDVII